MWSSDVQAHPSSIPESSIHFRYEYISRHCSVAKKTTDRLVHSRAHVPNEIISKLSGSTVKVGPAAWEITDVEEMSEAQSPESGALAVTFWQLHWTTKQETRDLLLLRGNALHSYLQL